MNFQNKSRKKSSLSLARKRKRRSVDENDPEEGSGEGGEYRDPIGGQEHGNVDRAVRLKSGSAFPDSGCAVKETSKKKCSVLKMLQKPPKQVSCPVCRTSVVLCKINQHLDNECPGCDTQSQGNRRWPSDEGQKAVCQDAGYSSAKIGVQSVGVHHTMKILCPTDNCTISTANESYFSHSCAINDCLAGTGKHNCGLGVHASTSGASGCSSVFGRRDTNKQPIGSERTGCESEATVAKDIMKMYHPDKEKVCKCFAVEQNSQETKCQTGENHPEVCFSDRCLKCSEKIAAQKPNCKITTQGTSCSSSDGNHSPCLQMCNSLSVPIGDRNTASNEATCATKNRNILNQKNKTTNKDKCDQTTADEEKSFEPYYLANFKLVLDTVLSNENEASLFNEEDRKVLSGFSSLSTESQKLYIRLFQRKFGWFKCSKLDYPKISNDLRPMLKVLVDEGFLKDEKELTDLKEVLHLIPAPGLRSLAKTLHILPPSSKKGQSKECIMDAFVKHSDKQLSLFGSSSKHILKRAKGVLGPCVHVTQKTREVFCRVILLFTMNIIPEDEDNGQAQQLSTLFLVNGGRLAYPPYRIYKPTPVFSCRDDLLQFAEAYREKHEMFLALDAGDLELAFNFYPKAKTQFACILAELEARKQGDQSCKSTWLSLPLHLRCFTSEWVYTKMCYLGVEVLQKMRRYEEAVSQLESLLRQDALCVDCRGCWWDRLALNLQQHLRQPQKAFEAVKQALLDPFVRSGRRLALVQRAMRIIASPGYSKLRDKVETIDDSLLEEPNSPNAVTITGKRSAQLGVFISHDIDKNGDVIEDTLTYCSVEEYTLAHFRKQGYDQGIHGEGSVFTTLYGLLMWDVLFTEGVPDVFRAPFQSAPLDIYFDTFYESREKLIQEKLAGIRSASTEELQHALGEAWETHQDQVCVGVSWDRFTGPEQAKQLAACFGGQLLADIFEVFARDLRHTRSGLPDLVVWNSSSLDYRVSRLGWRFEGTSKIVEVKGPGDRLSTKQQLWLDRLTRFGACAQVCYVTAVGGKKLRRYQPD